MARPAIAAMREEDEGDGEHRAGFHAPGCRQPRGPDAVVVRAAHAVGVVVRVVHADLQRDGDDEARERDDPVEHPVASTAAPVPISTGVNASGRVRRRAAPTQSRKVAGSMRRGSRETCAFSGLPRGFCFFARGTLAVLARVACHEK